MPPKLLAYIYIVILCFEGRYPKQNRVTRLISNILLPQPIARFDTGLLFSEVFVPVFPAEPTARCRPRAHRSPSDPELPACKSVPKVMGPRPAAPISEHVPREAGPETTLLASVRNSFRFLHSSDSAFTCFFIFF